MDGPVVWLPDAWRAREHENRPQALNDSHLHKKLDHILSGIAVTIDLLQSLKKGQTLMEAELQPVADAISNLATEEGEVANAVKVIVDKVNNGQVVVKEDAQSLVDGINNVINGLKTVVSSTQASDPAPQTDPLPGPTDSGSSAPVASTIPDVPAPPLTPVPVGPDLSSVQPAPGAADGSTGGEHEAPDSAGVPPTPAVTEPQQQESSPVADTTDSSSSEASPAS